MNHSSPNKQFYRWMIKDRRASESPIAHLDGLNVKMDRWHDRRAWTVEELLRLLNAAKNGAECFGMTGSDRYMLYRLAVESGLRSGELRSLTRASFDRDADTPTVTVAAEYSKHRCDDTLPLRSDTAELLRTYISHKLPDAPVFNMPKQWEVARMLRADLDTARQIWLKEAADAKELADREKMDFLRYIDDSGRVADFHALRHTFITNLASGGVHPKAAQALARHWTITLTMDRYSHSYQGEQSAALATLPYLSSHAGAETLRATGTEAIQPNGPVLAQFA